LVLKNQDPTPTSRISAKQDLESPLQCARNKILNLPLSVLFTNGFQTQNRMVGIAVYPPGIFANT